MTKPIFPHKDSDTNSDEEMKEIMEKGVRVVTEDDNIRVISYLYNDHVYVYDVENIYND